MNPYSLASIDLALAREDQTKRSSNVHARASLPEN